MLDVGSAAEGAVLTGKEKNEKGKGETRERKKNTEIQLPRVERAELPVARIFRLGIKGRIKKGVRGGK